MGTITLLSGQKICYRIPLKIRQNNQVIFWVSCVSSMSVGFFGGFNYSKMAKLGSWTHYNTFWIIFWNFQSFHQIWTRGPLTYYQNIFVNTRNTKICFDRYYFYISQHLGNPTFCQKSESTRDTKT